MTVRGYVLVEAEVGKAKGVAERIKTASRNGMAKKAKLVHVDTVTGPFDVIVQLEADDLDQLGNAITDDLAKVEGVQRTTTCLAVRLG